MVSGRRTRRSTSGRARGRPGGTGGDPRRTYMEVRGRRGDKVSINIRNGGRAAKVFLVNPDGGLVRVVGMDEYRDLMEDPSIANSARSVTDDTDAYLARGAVVDREEKEEVARKAIDAFEELMDRLEWGDL